MQQSPVFLRVLNDIRMIKATLDFFKQLDSPSLNISEFLSTTIELKKLYAICHSLMKNVQRTIQNLKDKRKSYQLHFPQDLFCFTMQWIPLPFTLTLKRVCKHWSQTITDKYKTLHSQWFGGVSVPSRLEFIKVSTKIRIPGDKGAVESSCLPFLHYDHTNKEMTHHIMLFRNNTFYTLCLGGHQTCRERSESSVPIRQKENKRHHRDGQPNRGYEQALLWQQEENPQNYEVIRVIKELNFKLIQLLGKERALVWVADEVWMLFIANDEIHPRYLKFVDINQIRCDDYLDVQKLICREPLEDEDFCSKDAIREFRFKRTAIQDGGHVDKYVITLIDRGWNFNELESAFLVLWKDKQQLSSYLVPFGLQDIKSIAVNNFFFALSITQDFDEYKVAIYTHSGKLWKILALPWAAHEILLTDQLLICCCQRFRKIHSYRFIF